MLCEDSDAFDHMPGAKLSAYSASVTARSKGPSGVTHEVSDSDSGGEMALSQPTSPHTVRSHAAAQAGAEPREQKVFKTDDMRQVDLLLFERMRVCCSILCGTISYTRGSGTESGADSKPRMSRATRSVSLAVSLAATLLVVVLILRPGRYLSTHTRAPLLLRRSHGRHPSGPSNTEPLLSLLPAPPKPPPPLPPP